MRVNVARVWEDSDYEHVKELCMSTRGWNEVYKKKETTIWVQAVPNSTYQMLKAQSYFADVSPSVIYDVIHDNIYRPKWDKHMAASKDIGLINPNNDVGYYALSSLPPIRPRDFVMQRSWLDTGDEKLICSQSVCHDEFPPNKAYVRGTLLLSGYYIRAAEQGGSNVIYISHSDPKGRLPTWLVNRVSKVIAPKIIKKLHKACIAYPEWKKQNMPYWRPWSTPDQQVDMPRVDLSKCQPKDYEQQVIDESSVRAVAGKDVDDEEED